jgi:hypothetical protein
MKVFKRVWNDVKRGENLDLYITVVVAFTIGILNLFGYTNQILATAITLAALGILTASSLRDKHSHEKSFSSLENVHSEIKQLSDTVNERLQATTSNRSVELKLLQKLSTNSEDVLSKITISSSIDNAGLIDITMQPRNLNWDDLFDKVNEIDVFFTYARTWRNVNNNLLDQFIRRKGCRLRVVLPDPENNVILQELSNRFAKSPEEFRNLIHEATKDYLKMREIGGKYGTTVEIWHASVTPMFTIYRFDKTVILALGSYKSAKGDVPHLICQPEGTLYKYATGEFETLIGEDGRLIATKIT